MRITKEVKVGVMAILCIATIVVGYRYLRDGFVWRDYKTIYVKYPRTAGLDASDDVTLKGYPIGKVSKINLKFQGDSAYVMTTLHITEPVDLPVGSKAMISSGDIFGDVTIEFVLGRGRDLIRSGDTLIGLIDTGLVSRIEQELRPVREKVFDLVQSIERVIEMVEKTFEESLAGTISSTTESLRVILDEARRASTAAANLLQNQEQRVDSVMRNLNQITATFRDSREDIQRIITNTANISDSLAQANLQQTFLDIGTAVSGLNDIVEALQDPENSTGSALLHNRTLYDNLERASYQLDSMLVMINKNPGRFFSFINLKIGGKR